jgi:hypothetical protein
MYASHMRWFFGFLIVLLLIGGGLRLAGMHIPLLDYPLGGPITQPRIEIVQPGDFTTP